MITSPCKVIPFKNLIRCICSTTVSSAGKGIRGAVKGLCLQERELQELEPDDLENMTETSYDNFVQQAANIESDAKSFQDQLRHKTIQHKYFNDHGPFEENLLTWSMKEQLRYLHSTDPDHWTPEVLADAFPISAEGVVLLLQSRWIPTSEAERRKHDRQVVSRWKKHLKGQLGSFKLLEKTIHEKFSTETLPSPVPGMDQILGILDGLIFDEKPQGAKELRRRNQLPKSRLYRKSFYSIIEEFQNEKSEGESQSEVHFQAKNISMLPSIPQYEGSYSKVMEEGKTTLKRNRHAGRKKELVTFAEFIKKRT